MRRLPLSLPDGFSTRNSTPPSTLLSSKPASWPRASCNAQELTTQLLPTKTQFEVFLALVNYYNLECDQVDIKAAFLNGELAETIYLEPPEGSDTPSDHVWQLKRSIYGRKQAPRCFNKALDSWLRSAGRVPTSADSCPYVRRQGDTIFQLLLQDKNK